MLRDHTVYQKNKKIELVGIPRVCSDSYLARKVEDKLGVKVLNVKHKDGRTYLKIEGNPPPNVGSFVIPVRKEPPKGGLILIKNVGGEHISKMVLRVFKQKFCDVIDWNYRKKDHELSVFVPMEELGKCLAAKHLTLTLGDMNLVFLLERGEMDLFKECVVDVKFPRKNVIFARKINKQKLEDEDGFDIDSKAFQDQFKFTLLLECELDPNDVEVFFLREHIEIVCRKEKHKGWLLEKGKISCFGEVKFYGTKNEMKRRLKGEEEEN